MIENLVEPGAVGIVEIILGQKEAAKLKKVLLLSDTIKRVQKVCFEQLVESPKGSQNFKLC